MKQLKINSVQFRLVLEGFSQWLKTQNYTPDTCERYPVYIREVFHYMENQGIFSIEKLSPYLIGQSVAQIKIRRNCTRGGGLSAGTINRMLSAVSRFFYYLKAVRGFEVFAPLQMEAKAAVERDILSQEEVKLFFDAASSSGIYRERNLAILALLYGAALRRNELVRLDVEDVIFGQKAVHVRYGKGNRQRIVPMADHLFGFVKQYIISERDDMQGKDAASEEALFLSQKGKRITASVLYYLIQTLREQIGMEAFSEKNITPHSFRHSIATHLLARGMSIEQISRWLGHSSLNSTMIYTHITEKFKL